MADGVLLLKGCGEGEVVMYDHDHDQSVSAPTIVRYFYLAVQRIHFGFYIFVDVIFLHSIPIMTLFLYFTIRTPTVI